MNFNKLLMNLTRKMEADPSCAKEVVETVMTRLDRFDHEDQEVILRAVELLDPTPEFFNVRLTGFVADKKIPAIKVVSFLTGRGLVEAKQTVEGTHDTILLKKVTKKEAERRLRFAQDQAGCDYMPVDYVLEPA